MFNEGLFVEQNHRWLWKMIVMVFFGGIILILAPWSSPLAGFGRQYTVRAKSAYPSQAEWRQRDFTMINQHFELVESDFSIEIIKAIAWYESEWQHMDSAGQLVVNGTIVRRSGVRRKTYDVGIMQINEDANSLDESLWDLEKIKIDPIYNIAAGVRVLENKRDYVRYLQRRKDWSRIELKYNMAGRSELEMTLKAYNGLRRSWVYSDKINQLMVDKPWEKAMVGQWKKDRLRADVRIMKTPVVSRYQPTWELRPDKRLFQKGTQTSYRMIHILDEAL